MKVLLFVVLIFAAIVNITLGQDAENFSQDQGLSEILLNISFVIFRIPFVFSSL